MRVQEGRAKSRTTNVNAFQGNPGSDTSWSLSRRDPAKIGMVPKVNPMTHRSDLAAAQAPPDDPLALVDPELRPVARAFLRPGGLPPHSDETLAQIRRGGPIDIKPLLLEIPVSEHR